MPPPYRPPAPRTLGWVVRSCEAVDVMRVERLVGGITADVDLLVLRRRDAGPFRVVLRRWTDTAAWTNGLVERESAALAALGANPVPAPRVLASDPTGTHAGVRCLLMSELPGAVSLPARPSGEWLQRLAEVQVAVHRTPAVLAARSDGLSDADADATWILDRGLRRAASDAAVAAGGDDVFAHGDFQPFNVLWRAVSPSGVVDWPNAGTGSRGVDVGHCLLNLAVLHGADTATDYRRRYEALSGVRVGTGGLLRALLGWDRGWQQFIPVQVAGRMPVDIEGMRDRVVETVRRTLDASTG